MAAANRQQSYEGKKLVYMPQYFRQNNPLISLGMQFMTPESVRQYQIEERSQIANRMHIEGARLTDLMRALRTETLSSSQNIRQLRSELTWHYHNSAFDRCQTMGDLVKQSLTLSAAIH